MAALLVFGITLTIAVLVSDLASRSVLSTTVIFLLAGFLAGGAVLGLIHAEPDSTSVHLVVELALVSTLFSDGTRAPLRELRGGLGLPARALVLGLPLTIGALGLLAHLLLGFHWRQALLLGTVLGPTDPVFATAIIYRQDLSARLRRLLNVESGMNDGLAFPILLVLMYALSPAQALEALLLPTTLGVLLGVAVAWVVHRLERLGPLGASQPYRPMAAFALALTVFALSKLLGVNEFLSAFSAGVTVATLRSNLSAEFRGFSESVASVFKFAAVFLFGALVSPQLVAHLGWGAYLFAVLALVAVRPIALGLSLIGSQMDPRNFIAAAWFGPKGFASVLFAVMVLEQGSTDASEIFHVAALIIGLSMVAHSSTGVIMARWLLARHGDASGDPPVAGPASSGYP